MTETATVHATAVSVAERALLIKGPSGTGKSSLALEMMARGARLVADDQVVLTRHGNSVRAHAPAPLLGLIEARGLGLLNADAHQHVSLCAVLDLADVETRRLPKHRDVLVLGVTLPLLHNVVAPTFPAALVQYLKGGRRE